MDFKLTKISHVFAFFLLACSILITIILPVIAFFQPFPSSSTLGLVSLPDSLRLVFELFVVFFSLVIVYGLFILVPILWYILVNRLHLREIFQRMNLRFERIDKMFFWSLIAAGGGLLLSIGMDLIFMQLGYNLDKVSNIPQLEQLFSLPALIILITVQPVAEEIFFRGFLLEKINGFAGPAIAILSTGALFGIAHLSYGMLYTAFSAGIMGAWFGLIVIKTKNLYPTIIGHILINVTSIALYVLGKSVGI